MTALDQLAAFFQPKGVAVIGASADPSKVGGSVLANLRAGGFPGTIVPVNLRRAVVQGLAAVPSIRDVAAPVDLAIIAVPAPAVFPALKDCAAHGVSAAIVLSAGFGEAGAEGEERERELRAWLRDQSLRVLGPNCLGWIRPSARLNATFAPAMPRSGPIGFLSHSGALATAILDWSRDTAVGFSLFASLGNQVDVAETEVIEALAEDSATRVIVGYLEGVADGRRFFAALRSAAARKPCLLMKAGRSAEGARAVSSHTGALAGSDRAFEAAVVQAGAIRCATLEELFDLAKAAAMQPLPTSRRVAIVTNGGGLGILATDAATEAGLEMPPLDELTRERLVRVLPTHAAVRNPLDLIGDATAARYDAALHALAAFDASRLVMLAPQAITDASGVARAVLGAARQRSAPMLAVFAGGARVRAGVQVLEEGGVPCLPFPERAVRTLAGMATLAERRRAAGQGEGRLTMPGAATAAMASLRMARPRRIGFLDALPLLHAYGIEALPARLATSAEESRAIARAIGFPVALKVVSPDIVHKTDVGGVALGLSSPTQVGDEVAAMMTRVRGARPGAQVDGILVQAMAPPGGFELLLGMVRDPQFGPLVMLAFGGIYVEVLRDTVTRLAPLSTMEALAMVNELRMVPALRGARGRRAVDLVALAQTICRFAELVADVADLDELEINPLVVGATGSVAVDVRGALRSPS